MTPLDLANLHFYEGVSVTAVCFLALAVYRTFFRGRGRRQ